MAFISWIVVGGLVGWMFGLVTGQVQQNQTRTNVAAGIIGGVLGGFVMGLGSGESVTGFTWYTYLSAVGGAVLLLAVVYLLKR